MYKNLLVIYLITISVFTNASMPLEVSMLEVVTSSDHILTVDVIDVDMVDVNGKVITDRAIGTGPGRKNLIRLICKVKAVHASNSNNIPNTIRIPLNPIMHYSLGQIIDVYKGKNSSILVLLKSDEYLPAYPGVFSYPIVELETILALHNLEQ